MIHLKRGIIGILSSQISAFDGVRSDTELDSMCLYLVGYDK